MKAFSVSVRFDMPQAGTLPVTASSPEEATQKIKVLLSSCRNVEVVEAVEVPISTIMGDIALDARELADAAEIVIEEADIKKAN